MPTQCSLIIERNVTTRMRDGTMLYADVYRPASGGPFPGLLQRTPYNKDLLSLSASIGDPLRFASEGYACNLTDGIIRASMRHTLRSRSPLQPGEQYMYKIDLPATSHVYHVEHHPSRLVLPVIPSDT